MCRPLTFSVVQSVRNAGFSAICAGLNQARPALADKDLGGKALNLRDNVTSFPQFICKSVTIRL